MSSRLPALALDFPLALELDATSVASEVGEAMLMVRPLTSTFLTLLLTENIHLRMTLFTCLL